MIRSRNSGGGLVAVSLATFQGRIRDSGESKVPRRMRLVTMAAAAREESRGVHFRSDHPDLDKKRDGQHLILQRTDDALKISTA